MKPSTVQVEAVGLISHPKADEWAANLTTGITGCCARAASGQTSAIPAEKA